MLSASKRKSALRASASIALIPQFIRLERAVLVQVHINGIAIVQIVGVEVVSSTSWRRPFTRPDHGEVIHLRLRGKQCPKAVRGVVTLISNPTAVEATQARIEDGRDRSRPQKTAPLIEAEVLASIIADVVKLGREPIDRLDARDTRHLQRAPIELNARRAAEAVVRAAIGGVQGAPIHANGGGTRDEGVRRVIDGNRARSAKPQGLSRATVIIVRHRKRSVGGEPTIRPTQGDARGGDRTAADKGPPVADGQRTDIRRRTSRHPARGRRRQRGVASKGDPANRTLRRHDPTRNTQATKGGCAVGDRVQRGVASDHDIRGRHIQTARHGRNRRRDGVGGGNAVFTREIPADLTFFRSVQIMVHGNHLSQIHVEVIPTFLPAESPVAGGTGVTIAIINLDHHVGIVVPHIVVGRKSDPILRNTPRITTIPHITFVVHQISLLIVPRTEDRPPITAIRQGEDGVFLGRKETAREIGPALSAELHRRQTIDRIGGVIHLPIHARGVVIPGRKIVPRSEILAIGGANYRRGVKPSIHARNQGRRPCGEPATTESQRSPIQVQRGGRSQRSGRAVASQNQFARSTFGQNRRRRDHIGRHSQLLPRPRDVDGNVAPGTHRGNRTALRRKGAVMPHRHPRTRRHRRHGDRTGHRKTIARADLEFALIGYGQTCRRMRSVNGHQ